MNQVYITRLSSYLPNTPIESDEIEDVLGRIGGVASRSRRIVLRSNGISKRYYALDKEGVNTHTNAQLASEAVKLLFDQNFKPENLQLLCCGTSTPDQLFPSHAAMVHGSLGNSPLEIASLSGICCSGMHALKYGYMSVLSGQSTNAVCTGSELVSPYLIARNFEQEFKTLEELEARPILAFEKEFLRWMLSDGAGAMLIENKPGPGLSLRIDWMESISYANEQPACMYGGADKVEDGNLKGWMTYAPEEWSEKSLFSIKQDVKLLEKNIVRYGGRKLASIVEKRNIIISEIDYFLPHLSSEFFRKKIQEELILMGVDIPAEKWFTNLSEVGNMGSASIYVIIDALVKSGNLKKGQKVLIMVPESGRFSYVYAHLTVV